MLTLLLCCLFVMIFVHGNTGVSASDVAAGEGVVAVDETSRSMAKHLLSKISQQGDRPSSWNTLASIMEKSFGIQNNDASQSMMDDTTSIMQQEHQNHDNARQKALHWLAHDDKVLEVSKIPKDQYGKGLLQRYALATIYYATGGDEHWSSCSAIDSSTPTPCESAEARYLSPYSHLKWDGINGNKDQLITWLDLSSHNLTTRNFLPMELVLLSPSLELLWISENDHLEGELPSWIGDFQNLVTLSAYKTGMYGSLPENLYKLSTKLNSLRLYKSKFSGTISSDIGRALPELKWLWLHDNQFTGRFPPSIGKLAKLEGLTLHGNNFEVVKEDHEKEGNLKGNVIPKEVCSLRTKKLTHLWGDCEEGALEFIGRDNGDGDGDGESKGMVAQYNVVDDVRACSCCTKCFPRAKKDDLKNDGMKVVAVN